VASLRAVAPRLLDTLAQMPYAESGSTYNDPTRPHAYSGSAITLSGLDATAARTVFDQAGPDAPVPFVVDLRHLGGAPARTPKVPRAVGHRDAAYLLRVLSAAGSEAARAAHERVFAAMRPWATGGRSLNVLYYDDPAQVRYAYEPDDLRRLAELKAVHDPADPVPPQPQHPAGGDKNSASASCVL
jgi:hypothetical protein